MKKVLIGVLIFIIAIFLVLFFYNIFKKNESIDTKMTLTESSGIDTDKDLIYKKNLINFEEISREEYESKKTKYYSQGTTYPIPKTLPNRIERRGDCLIFQDINGKKSELELCDYIPTDPKSIQIKLYQNPTYIDTINAYLIRQSMYEGGRMYFLNADYPYSLEEIFGVPIFSEDKKYFFLHASVEVAYATNTGLEIWKVQKYDNDYIGYSRIAYFSSGYFGTDVSEAFWVGNDIYLKTSWRNYESYLKATIDEFPTDLPRG